MQQVMGKQRFPVQFDTSFLIAALIVPIVHFCLGYIGLSMTFVNGASVFWPSLGVFLAVMLLVGYRVWPILFISDFTVSYILFFKKNFLLSSIIPAINLITPLVATFLIHRFIKHRNFLERSQDVFKFAVITVLSPLISSLLAALTLCANHIIPWTAFADVCRTWLTSDSAGILVVTPLLLAWLQKSPSQTNWNQQKILELVSVLLLVITIAHQAFWEGYPIEYMVIPPLMWLAYRFEARVSSSLTLIVSAIAIFGTVRGFGPFARLPSPNESLILLQSFICVIAAIGFVVCAVTQESRKAHSKLKQANEELEQRVHQRTMQLEEARKTLLL